MRAAVYQRPPQAGAHRPGHEFTAPRRPGGGAVPADAGRAAGRDPVCPAGTHRHQRGAGAGLSARAGDPAGQVPAAVPPCGDAVPPAGQRCRGRWGRAGRAGRGSGHRPWLCRAGAGAHHPAGRPRLPAGATGTSFLGKRAHPAGRAARAAGAAAQPAAGSVQPAVGGLCPGGLCPQRRDRPQLLSGLLSGAGAAVHLPDPLRARRAPGAGPGAGRAAGRYAPAVRVAGAAAGHQLCLYRPAAQLPVRSPGQHRQPAAPPGTACKALLHRAGAFQCRRKICPGASRPGHPAALCGRQQLPGAGRLPRRRGQDRKVGTDLPGLPHRAADHRSRPRPAGRAGAAAHP